MNIEYTPIGTIRTPFKTKNGMPIQPAGAAGIRGTVELKREFTEGLLDLDGFSHVILIYHFDKSDGFDLQVTPFLDDKAHGVFSTRAPKRPNPIGISVVKLKRISDNILEIENVDMLDGTPLLDIKPFIPAFDVYEVEKTGWMKHNISLKDFKSDNRFY
ncbi:tRNA (N6-threonylcarbamoyladenosine(37)-N6)-methyltransferase TrmO [Mariniphaga sp.]|uniref:tRNA (N6-threonylcarbamoyladenosine(37)-N6)-methyltransferase TrmO n=1 Tax=Mariniphaga sp. TaxID=1954475 RepID=UPI003567D7AF